MNTSEKLELAHWVAGQAQKNGADEAAVDLAASRDIEVSIRDNKLETLTESTQNSLSISVYAGGRYSAHSTNDIRKESLEKFVREAVSMTKYLAEDPYRGLPDPKYYEGQLKADLKLHDVDYEALTTEDRIRMAKEIEEAALARSDKILTVTSGFSDSFYEAVKVHSNGFEGSERGTYYSAGGEATVKGKEDGRPSGWDWRTWRYRKDMNAFKEMGEGAVDKALAKVGQAKIESGVYDMIVHNRAATRALGALLGPMTGTSLYRKSSFLEGKLGERIGSEKLTWIDDPHLVHGFGSGTYDNEGMATKKRVMIDKGILKSFFIDCYYGRKLDMEPTTGGKSNFLMEYGDKSVDDMIKQVKKGIFVTQFIGGNSNGTTGDYSYGIMGMLIEDGKLIKPVNEMNISGNQVDLWNKLVEVGNDPYMYSSWRRPSLYFKDVDFAGK